MVLYQSLPLLGGEQDIFIQESFENLQILLADSTIFTDRSYYWASYRQKKLGLKRILWVIVSSSLDDLGGTFAMA